MSKASRHDTWQAGNNYDQYMGRWSRQIAPLFLDWLAVPDGLDWLEIGCGTGALSAAILARCGPNSLLAIDPSEGFLATARTNVPDRRAEFVVGDAQTLPVESSSKDVIASALVLNFVPDRERALDEMKRVGRMGATVGLYVWDYPGGGVEFLHAFWTVASVLDQNASDLAEDKRFPLCTQTGLADLAKGAGLVVPEVMAIEIATVFDNFDEYWHPFTLGAGPAPGYCMGLPAQQRQQLKAKLSESLPRREDGSILLKARAWALRATIN